MEILTDSQKQILKDVSFMIVRFLRNERFCSSHCLSLEHPEGSCVKNGKSYYPGIIDELISELNIIDIDLPIYLYKEFEDDEHYTCNESVRDVLKDWLSKVDQKCGTHYMSFLEV